MTVPGLKQPLQTVVAESAGKTAGTDLHRKSKGSGLCLAVTKQLAELHGGSMWVDSEGETGSRVSFTIPLRSCTGII
ncbi:MAG: ATP-binding protein [Desulfuromonadaceae bacterium]